MFYLKFFEHPSFGQVAYEIYPSEWKVHSSEISITIMYCWYMFLMAVATDLTHVTILIQYVAAWVLFLYLIKGHVERFRKVPNPYDWMLKCSYRLKKKINQCCRDACQISEQLEDSKRLSGKLRQDFLWRDIESAPRPVQCSANSSLIVLDK